MRLFLSELDSERRALEDSEREKRLLASRVDDLSGRLELAERERREVWYADMHMYTLSLSVIFTVQY